MKIKDDEMIIKKREYYNLLIENAKLKEQASPFHNFSINEIRQILGFSKLGPEEENKIPKKIEGQAIRLLMTIKEQIIANKINEIIDYLDYLKSKGE